MTETSIAQINDRIAHLRLVYGDADQDAALLEALLKDRVRVKALEDALRQINSITEASFPGATSAVDVAEVQRVARANLSASQPAQTLTVQDAARVPEIAALIEKAEALSAQASHVGLGAAVKGLDITDAARELSLLSAEVSAALRAITEGSNAKAD